MHVFLIGPASVGKTTVGKLLAEALRREFVDIDQEFCERIEPIGDYLKSKGYPAYCEANSGLVDTLLSERVGKNIVFATPSGFLVHDKSPRLVKKHLQLLSQYISVLLLPSREPESVADIIVQRQIERYGSSVNSEEQKERFLDRFEKYKNHGDIQIFSMETPDTIVQKILLELEGRGFLVAS